MNGTRNVREGQNKYTYISENASEMMLKSNEHMYVISSGAFLFVDQKWKESIFFSKDQGRVQ